MRLAFRERDELTSQLAAMKSRYEQTRQKEEDAYQQVKHAVDMVEHAQLEQTQVRQPPIWQQTDLRIVKTKRYYGAVRYVNIH